jgi:hypothetical protein
MNIPPFVQLIPLPAMAVVSELIARLRTGRPEFDPQKEQGHIFVLHQHQTWYETPLARCS